MGDFNPFQGNAGNFYSPRQQGKHSRKHRIWSQNEVYGSQYDDKAYEKIYLQDTSHFQKDRKQSQHFKKVKQTSQSYGQFYSPRNDYKGRMMYDINSDLVPPPYPRLDRKYQVTTNNAPYNPLNQAVNTVNTLPPINTPRGSESSREPPFSFREHAYRDRDTGYRDTIQPSDSIVNLPDIKNIELKVDTGDNSVILYPGRYGCDFSSVKDGRSDFAVPDIRELHVKIENFDGSSYNFSTVPKRYDHR